ncbi:MAG: anion transporter [Burkholderiales bacterium]|nr:anion transporter [Burkholderiales bacterium]
MWFHPAADWGVVLVFALVYLGMLLGGLPALRLDRSGVALLGAIAMLGLGVVDSASAAAAVDVPTVLLLFSFMVMSAQMRLGGFYTAVTRWVGERQWPRAGLLAGLIAVAAGLSAVFSNDVVCLAMTPVVARMCLQRGLHPVPWLVGLACAANIGSAATLIGNPQNMLIGSVLGLEFGAYLWRALPPVVLSLGLLWAWLVWGPARAGGRSAADGQAAAPGHWAGDEPSLDRWQTTKGLAVAGLVLLAFLVGPWPHEVVALVGAAVLLLSRRLHSSHVMTLVDWQLLVLFMGLFVVNHAFEQTGLAAEAVAVLAAQGIHLSDTGPLFAAGVLLSNVVSNVPAVMLLLPHVQGSDAAAAGLTLALASTLAGNLLLVGSIANLIVADLAAQQGIAIDWKAHARIGVPVTVLTLGVVAGWLRWGV